MTKPLTNKGLNNNQIRSHAHALLALLLILTRPSIWDGVSAALPTVIWYAVLLTALGLWAVEAACGWRKSFISGWAGWAAAIAVVAFIPAALRGPDGYDGWALTGMWASMVAFAAYLGNCLRGRERLLWIGLVGSLSLQLLYSMGQMAWSLPAMMAMAEAGDLNGPVNTNDLLERIRNGGVFGSFTVSNGLAAFLIALFIPIFGTLTRAKLTGQRVALGILCVLCAGIIYATRSKGAMLAAGAGIGVALLWHGRSWWRWIPIGGAALGLVALTALPSIQSALIASADVRFGYWGVAWQMILSAPLHGWGIGGFAAHAAATLPIGAEFARQVHNEPLEAWVIGGLLAGIPTLAWMALSVRTPRVRLEDATATVEAQEARAESTSTIHPGILIGLPLLVIPYLHVFGLLPVDNWPGSSNGLSLIWAFVLGGGAAAAMSLAARCPLPPAWAIHAGLIAVMLHACQDFDFHSGGVLSTVVVLSVYAGSGRQMTWQHPWIRGLPAVLFILGVISFAIGVPRGRAIEQANTLLTTVQQLPDLLQREPQFGQRVWIDCHDQLQAPLPTTGPNPATYRPLLSAAINHAWTVFTTAPPGTPDQRASIVRLLPAGADRLVKSQQLVADLPFLPRAYRLLAEDLCAMGQWESGLAEARQAVVCAPWHLPHRQGLLRLLQQAATATGDSTYTDAAVAEQRLIDEYTPQVHPRDRPIEAP